MFVSFVYMCILPMFIGTCYMCCRKDSEAERQSYLVKALVWGSTGSDLSAKYGFAGNELQLYELQHLGLAILRFVACVAIQTL